MQPRIIPILKLTNNFRFHFSYYNVIKVFSNKLHSSTINNKKEAVDLSYFVFQPENQSTRTPIIILHGLLGSKQNWRGLGKAIAVKLNRKVYALDARNHGDSSHSENFTYPSMSEDVRQFMHSHNIPKAVMIGHSMGGRTAMHVALTSKELVDQLVVVDVSPFQLPKESSFSLGYMRSMQEAFQALPKTNLVQARKSIDDYLAKSIPEVPIRQFLLTNLTEKNKVVSWKPNLQAILRSFEEGIVKFPATSNYYPDETLFICGEKSSYVLIDDYPKIKTLFPKAEFLVVPDAGHWVHSDKPSEFLQALYNFL